MRPRQLRRQRVRWRKPPRGWRRSLGVGNEVMAALTLCDALACDREWQTLAGRGR